ncbi:MAG: hypothetical protein U1D35_12075 [Paracoccaceae bacterium]|nr:hypothetical protein [Paracoccaceae bacterium]
MGALSGQEYPAIGTNAGGDCQAIQAVALAAVFHPQTLRIGADW